MTCPRFRIGVTVKFKNSSFYPELNGAYGIVSKPYALKGSYDRRSLSRLHEWIYNTYALETDRSYAVRENQISHPQRSELRIKEVYYVSNLLYAGTLGVNK